MDTKKSLGWLKHWNQYQQFIQHLQKHLPHIKYLFQKKFFEEHEYDEFKKNNNIIGLESITESDCQ